jgi:membrane protein EpsK
VRWPGIVTLVLGIAQVALAITLVTTTGLGSAGVALAGAIVLTMKNAIFTPWYCARILKQPAWTFIAPMVPSLVAAVAVTGAAYCVADALGSTRLLPLALAGAGLGLVYAPLCLLLAFRHSERLAVLRLITGRRDEAGPIDPVDPAVP